MHPGIQEFKEGLKEIPIDQIPGIREAGWQSSGTAVPEDPAEKDKKTEYYNNAFKNILTLVSYYFLFIYFYTENNYPI